MLLNEYWRGDLSRFPLAREAAGYQVYSKQPGVPPRAGILNTNGQRPLAFPHSDRLRRRTSGRGRGRMRR